MSDFDDKVINFFENYQDRGMKKWSGFFLSDHTLKINQDQHHRATIYHKKEQMSEEKIGALLLKAFSEHRYVIVQLKEVNTERNFLPDICGFVEGYHDEQIIISGQIIVLNDINNVQLKNSCIDNS